jgi:hypothetical protein
MGTWGIGISQDDTVADIIGFIVDRLKSGTSLFVASEEAAVQFRELEQYEDEAPLLWIAIASAQWKYGQVEENVLRRVESDIRAGRGLDRWRDDDKALAKRIAGLQKFLDKIGTPNPSPSAAPKIIVRRAPFEQGDCLAVSTNDGRYTAALVLRVDNSRLEFGMNLIGSLDYIDNQPPAITVFEQRNWLTRVGSDGKRRTCALWYLPVGFRKIRKRIAVVANVALRHTDPKESRSYTGWINLSTRITNMNSGPQSLSGHGSPT